MASKKGKIDKNEVRGERLKQIIAEQGITQAKLSEKMNYCQQQISRIVTGTSSLTENFAKRLIEVFPEYRFDWIMAEDDFQTEMHKKLYPPLEYIYNKRNMFKAVEKFLSEFGLSFQLSPVKGVDDMSTEEFENLTDSEMESVCKKTNDVLKSDNAYQFKSSNGEILFTCSSQEREDFIRDIYEYTEFKLNKMIERKGNNNGKRS